MANVLNEEKKQQVLALGRLGWPLRRIQQETRIRRETASQYLKAAGIAVRLPGGWGRRAAKPANQVITDFGAAKPAIAVITDPNCNPKTNPENPAAKGKATSRPANRVITDSEVITDLNPSQPHEVGAFSSEQVASPQRSPSASACESYREAIELGLSRGRNAMAIYQDLVSEYSFASSYQSVQRFVRKLRGAQTPEARVVTMPCRIQDPDRKGKVESGVGHAQKTPLKGLRFESLEEAQAYLDRWEERWADTRIHGTTKRQVAAMFAEEKPCLLPLPVEPFRYYQYSERVVHLDGCVEVEAAYYGAPPGWIGRAVRVQWDSLFVRLLDPKTGQLMREHVRQKRGWYRIKDEDRTKRTPPGTSKLLWRASRAGTHIGTLCEAIHRQQGEVGVRRILGVLSLAKKFGAAAVDDACAAALELGVQEYRFVRRDLERCPQAPLTLQQVDPLIRDLVQYRDLINHKTKEREKEEQP